MFERAIHRVIEQGMATIEAAPTLLDRFLRAPGWTDDEVAKLRANWLSEKGHPSIVHNYARAAASLPCYSIVLVGSNVSEDYLNRGADALALDEVTQLIAEIEAEIGRRVNVEISEWQFTYQVFAYSEHPDVTLAMSNVLRSILLGGGRKFVVEYGFNRPSFSEMDLQQQPPYLPENVFARVFQIVGYAHLCVATDLDLSPWDKRFSRIEGLHVANAVTGVYAGVHPDTEKVE